MSRLALGSQIVSPFQLDTYNLSLPFSKDRVSDPNFLSYNRSGSHQDMILVEYCRTFSPLIRRA